MVSTKVVRCAALAVFLIDCSGASGGGGHGGSGGPTGGTGTGGVAAGGHAGSTAGSGGGAGAVATGGNAGMTGGAGTTGGAGAGGGGHAGATGGAGGDSGTGPVSCAHPVALTSTVGGTFSHMVVDDQFAYWFEPDNGSGVTTARVRKVPVDGSGPAVDLFNESCQGIAGFGAVFASDVNNIYIVCLRAVDATHTVEIMTIPKNGAAPTPLFIADKAVPELNLGVQQIGILGTNVYFSCCNSGPELYSIPVGGGTPTPLLPTMPYSPFVNGFFYITGFGGNVYWQGSYAMTGALLQAPAGGGAVALIANDDALSGSLNNMVIRDSYFYWRSEGPPESFWRLPLSGGTPTQLAAMPNYGTVTGQIEIFGNYIYSAAYDGSGANNLILLSYRLPPAGAGGAGGAGAVGTPTIIATIPRPAGFSPYYNNQVRANSTHLFISDPANVGNNGHIYRCD